MSQTKGSKVAFNAENTGTCLCPKCPVQTKSRCVSDKMATINDALAKQPLNPEAIPGVHCATGVAACKDLDPSQTCSCFDCAVFSKHDLASATPVGYYCQDGFAK